MKVLIDSSCDIQYSSFYIYGLYKVYGRKNVKFSSKYFKKFIHNNHFFAFVILENENIKKVLIDFTDSSRIHSDALKWCDVYGKINLDDSMDLEKKVIPIGPSFGIRIFSLIETTCLAILNFLRAYHRIPDKRKFLSDYKAQYKRPKFSDYISERSENNYVFFMASLWKQEPIANNFRANFIKSCRANQYLEFEGGFAPRTKNDIAGYEDLTASSRVKMKVYLKKTIKSMLVFNTPAVKDCHGWKLAEYLCLGKAIISTQLTRQMPVALEDDKHILFTDGTQEDISKKVSAIILSPVLEEQLEVNSKAYFDNFLAPKQIILKLTAL